MIAGLPGFELSAMFYTVLLLGMGPKGLWRWDLRAGQLGRWSGRVTVRARAIRFAKPALHQLHRQPPVAPM